jgi:hypothetical protein
MITPTTELLKEVIEDTDELIEYVRSSSGDPNLPEWLTDLKRKIHTAYCRLTSPVEQQTKKHIPKDPYKKNSDIELLKSYLDAGELPPIGAFKSGLQCLNDKGN